MLSKQLMEKIQVTPFYIPVHSLNLKMKNCDILNDNEKRTILVHVKKY